MFYDLYDQYTPIKSLRFADASSKLDGRLG